MAISATAVRVVRVRMVSPSDFPSRDYFWTAIVTLWTVPLNANGER